MNVATEHVTRRSLLSAGMTAASLAAASGAKAADLFAAKVPKPAKSGWATASDGQRIRYESFGNGPVALVFIHGWMCDGTYWAGQIAPFAADYQVITLDLVGHGLSDKSRRDWSMDGLGSDVAQVVETAAPGKPVVLIGHSMGGYVALAAARHIDQAKLTGIAAVDIFYTAERLPEMKGGGMNLTEENFNRDAKALLRKSMFLPSADPVLADRVTASMAAGRPDIAIALGTAMTAMEVKPAFEALSATPLTLINADRRPTDAKSLKAAHPGVHVIQVKDVGHFIMLDAPQTFDSILRFELLSMRSRIVEL